MFDPPSLFLAAVATCVGGGVRGFTGFAGPMIMLPVMILLFGPVAGVVTVLLVDLTCNLTLVPEATRHVAWRVAAPLIAGTIVTIPLGSYVLLAVDSTIMTQAIIAAVVAISVVMLFGWRYRRVLNAFQLTGIGALSGALLSSAYIGAIVPIVLYAGPEAAARSRANVIIWAFVGAILVAATLSYGGAITQAELWRAAILAPIYLVSTFCGSRIFRGIDETLFRRTVLIILICASIGGLVFSDS